jgi:hypothetical protein
MRRDGKRLNRKRYRGAASREGMDETYGTYGIHEEENVEMRVCGFSAAAFPMTSLPWSLINLRNMRKLAHRMGLSLGHHLS